MDDILVSVIMPVYNSGKYLNDAIQSVIEQTYLQWELLIVDDASSDDSRNTIIEIANTDNRIHPIFLNKNSGAAIARNHAIDAARGKYIAFLDADDLWSKNKLELQVRFMEENKYDFTFTWYDIINNNSKIIKAPPQASYKNLLKNNTIGCLTAMYNAESLGKQYMPEIRLRQDYGLWLNILRSGVVAHCLPRVLAHYRTYNSSLSGNKFKVLKYNWQLLRKHQKLSLAATVYYFLCFIINKGLKYSPV